MRKPFDNNYDLSQGFGVNEPDYRRFGLKGHNGLDYLLPTGTPVLAPHDGKVIESFFDKDGYGNYVKIESSTEGSVLAHLESISVAIGYEVKEGDVIGASDSTGNSTGPHLHWGYYKIPRDRSNGFNGFIDQAPFLEEQKVDVIVKYKAGDRVRPNSRVPVGVSPGKESFDYGEISPTRPARIMGLQMFNGEVYYNISQVEIGGGTGWVGANELDVMPEYVEPSPSAPGPVTFPEEEYKKAVEECEGWHTKYNELSIIIAGFKALGYEKPDDVTNALNKKDETIIGLNKQLQQVLDRNAVLSKLVASKETEDSTAIDEGIKAMQENADLRKIVSEVSKKMGVKPHIFDITYSLDALKAVQNLFTKENNKPAEKIEKIDVTPEKKNWLLTLFNL